MDDKSRLEASIVLPGKHPSHPHECLGTDAFAHRRLDDMIDKPTLELFVLCGRELLALLAAEVLELDFSTLLGNCTESGLSIARE